MHWGLRLFRGVLRALLLGMLVLAPASVAAAATGTQSVTSTSTSIQTFYFHGAAPPNDDLNRAQGAPSATFDQNSPSGTTDSTQTGSVDANPNLAGNPLAVYWVSTAFTGKIDGTVHFDWYWSTANPEALALGETATVTIFADGAKIGQGDVPLTLGTSPTLNHSDVPNAVGTVTGKLLIQVTVDHVDTGNAVTAHYNSTAAPSSFQLPVVPTPPPAPPAQCTSKLCFSPPVVLPKSGDTGSTSDTCFNPCGEPS